MLDMCIGDQTFANRACPPRTHFGRSIRPLDDAWWILLVETDNFVGHACGHGFGGAIGPERGCRRQREILQDIDLFFFLSRHLEAQKKEYLEISISHLINHHRATRRSTSKAG